MKKEYINVNTNKLHDELILSGINPMLVECLDGKTWVTFEEGADMDLVQQIIDAHDPTPLPPKPTQEEELMNYILEVDFRLIMIEMGLI